MTDFIVICDDQSVLGSMLKTSALRAEQVVEDKRKLAEEALQAFLKAVVQDTPAWMNGSMKRAVMDHHKQTKILGTGQIKALKKELGLAIEASSDLVREWLDPKPTIWPHRVDFVHNGVMKYKSPGFPPEAIREAFNEAPAHHMKRIMRRFGWDVTDYKVMPWNDRLAKLINAYASVYDDFRYAQTDLRDGNNALEAHEAGLLWDKAGEE